MNKKKNENLTMDASISIKLPTELLEKAREKSANTGISISFIVRQAIEIWVKDDKKSE